MSSENLSPSVIASLARQIRALATAPPDGIKYIPSETNIAEVLADIEGPVGTPYEGGAFRVKLVLTREYPAAPPKGYFLTKIFHPNVSNTGDICVNTLKKDWTAETTIGHVLAVIRCLLIVPFPESSLNDDAGKMFMESYDEYCKKARLMTSVHAMAAGAAKTGAGAAAAGGAGAEAAAASGAVAAPAASATSSTSSAAPPETAKLSEKSAAGNASSGVAAAGAAGVPELKKPLAAAAAAAGGEGAAAKEAADKKKKTMKRL